MNNAYGRQQQQQQNLLRNSQKYLPDIALVSKLNIKQVVPQQPKKSPRNVSNPRERERTETLTQPKDSHDPFM